MEINVEWTEEKWSLYRVGLVMEVVAMRGFTIFLYIYVFITQNGGG